jgi:predicted  nucleic acid-binding Zn-ribbon protein
MKAWPDWDEFVRRLREDAAFREAVRRQVLTEDLLNLPAVVQAGLAALADRMERAEAQIRENGRQIAENSRQIAALTEALREFRDAAERRFAAAEAQIAENSRQIAALTEQVRENSRQIATLAEQVRENSRQIAENGRQIAALAEALRDFQAATDRRFAALEDDMGEVKGRGLEVEWTLKAPAYLGEYLDRTRVLSHNVLASMTAEARKAGRLTRGEAVDALRADVVCEAQDPATGERVRVVIEVSWRIGLEDVERARSRAALWSRLGLRAVAVAAGREADEAVRAKARELGVWVIEDGRRTVPEEPPLRET